MQHHYGTLGFLEILEHGGQRQKGNLSGFQDDEGQHLPGAPQTGEYQGASGEREQRAKWTPEEDELLWELQRQKKITLTMVTYFENRTRAAIASRLRTLRGGLQSQKIRREKKKQERRDRGEHGKEKEAYRWTSNDVTILLDLARQGVTYNDIGQ
jgi:hypothetical protein